MNPKQISFTRILGNLLIILSIGLLFYIYLPYFSLYFIPQKIDAKNIKSGLYIEIPKINAVAPIISDVNPWNESEYRAKLKEGVAQARGSALPGEKGTSFLFAHSSDSPWNMTRYNIAFLRLGELSINDKIMVYRNGKEFDYKVVGKKEVWPSEVSYLKETSDYNLILQTCTPIGTSLKRLLVFANLQM